MKDHEKESCPQEDSAVKDGEKDDSPSEPDVERPKGEEPAKEVEATRRCQDTPDIKRGGKKIIRSISVNTQLTRQNEHRCLSHIL